MAQVISGSVSKNKDCRPCDLKAEFNRQIDASSLVIFIVGDKTAMRCAGNNCHRNNNVLCLCTPYKQNNSGSKTCKVITTKGSKDFIGEIQKIVKEKSDVAQTLSALLGAAVNGSLGRSPVIGTAEAQYGTKWDASGVIRINSELVLDEYINIIVPVELNGTDQNQAYIRCRNFGNQYQAYGFLPRRSPLFNLQKKGHS